VSYLLELGLGLRHCGVLGAGEVDGRWGVDGFLRGGRAALVGL